MSWFRRKKYGKQILEAVRTGKEPLRSIVKTARQDGAQDEDIEEWWDFPEKFRQSITISENAFRLTMFRHLMEEEGKSEDEAAIMVKKTYPIYGRTGVEEEEKRDAQACKELGLTEKSRMLPPELRGRIDIYREKMGAQKILSLAKEYESYNAFLRDKIKARKAITILMRSGHRGLQVPAIPAVGSTESLRRIEIDASSRSTPVSAFRSKSIRRYSNPGTVISPGSNSGRPADLPPGGRIPHVRPNSAMRARSGLNGGCNPLPVRRSLPPKAA